MLYYFLNYGDGTKQVLLSNIWGMMPEGRITEWRIYNFGNAFLNKYLKLWPLSSHSLIIHSRRLYDVIIKRLE
jgi:hypothetical protein